jgi:hypothetical protein
MKARAIRSLLASTAILLALLLAHFDSSPLSGGELFCA